ncbi:MAG: CoA pyrophosphatase [Rhodoferax sp.]|jgi:8-oxo-dGTP pyrophosphatase MutT (NUDIX family)|nr:CoA pyrophosphatase [Rhodoferax sp.]
MANKLVIPQRPLPYFDPRKVPIVGVDNHLPAIHADLLQPSALKQRFAQPPVWHPELVAEKRFSDKALTPASVLIPIVMRDRPTVLLTERTLHLSNHSGQIAFPGGKADGDDLDTTVTALREAYEEVGLHAKYIHVLGELPHYSTGSGFVITPVVGLVETGFTLTRNPFEVADTFEVPLDFLMNPANHRRHIVEWDGEKREWLSMPYEDQLTQRFIWGATAGILRNFYRMLLS